MPDILLKPKIAGNFHSFIVWCNKAATHINRDAICIDSKGRRCFKGADFMRARDENAFPVYYFWDFEKIIIEDNNGL